MLDVHGYNLVKTPHWFTGAVTSRGDYTKEHHVVMCLNMGMTEIPKGYVIHHIDRDRANNSSLNLMLLKRERHTHLHNKGNTYGVGAKRTDEQKGRYSLAAKKRWADPEDSEKRKQAMRGKRKIIQCPHCGLKGGGGNMRRYHFDNCKDFGSAAMRR